MGNGYCTQLLQRICYENFVKFQEKQYSYNSAFLNEICAFDKANLTNNEFGCKP